MGGRKLKRTHFLYLALMICAGCDGGSSSSLTQAEIEDGYAAANYMDTQELMFAADDLSEFRSKYKGQWARFVVRTKWVLHDDENSVSVAAISPTRKDLFLTFASGDVIDRNSFTEGSYLAATCLIETADASLVYLGKCRQNVAPTNDE